MPERIYLIRHGETQENVEKTIQGWKNSGLTKEGHKQAKKLAKVFGRLNIDTIYASDLKRTCETAKYISQILNIPLIETHYLRELNFGKIEGTKFNESKSGNKLWKGYIEAIKRGEFNWNEHEGESINDLYVRIKEFFALLEKKHPDESIILVTHRGTQNRIFEILDLNDVTGEYIHFGNTSITILDKEDTHYKVVKLNDTTHLE